MSAEVEKRMKEMASKNEDLKWSDIPDVKYPEYDIYGKKYNPDSITDYISSFDIKRT